MIPKLQNAVNAVKQGVPQVRITSAKELLEQGTIIREKA
jgi:acetylglutamate kinase